MNSGFYQEEVRLVPRTLSDEEILDRGRRLARLASETSALERELKSHNQETKAEISRLEAEQLNVVREISSGRTFENQRCRWILDWPTGWKRLLAPDGSVVETTRITEDDRQLRILEEQKAERRANEKPKGEPNLIAAPIGSRFRTLTDDLPDLREGEVFRILERSDVLGGDYKIEILESPFHSKDDPVVGSQVGISLEDLRKCQAVPPSPEGMPSRPPVTFAAGEIWRLSEDFRTYSAGSLVEVVGTDETADRFDFVIVGGAPIQDERKVFNTTEREAAEVLDYIGANLEAALEQLNEPPELGLLSEVSVDGFKVGQRWELTEPFAGYAAETLLEVAEVDKELENIEFFVVGALGRFTIPSGVASTVMLNVTPEPKEASEEDRRPAPEEFDVGELYDNITEFDAWVTPDKVEPIQRGTTFEVVEVKENAVNVINISEENSGGLTTWIPLPEAKSVLRRVGEPEQRAEEPVVEVERGERYRLKKSRQARGTTFEEGSLVEVVDITPSSVKLQSDAGSDSWFRLRKSDISSYLVRRPIGRLAEARA